MDADPANTDTHVSDVPNAQEGPQVGRVIGSGLSRTGTRSVHAFLIRNSWPSVHYPFDASTQDALARADVCNLWPNRSILDLPSALCFEDLADDDPHCLVVHTTRDFDDWVTAVQRHYQGLVDDWDGLPARFTEFSEWISRRVYGAFPPTLSGIAAAGHRQQQRVDDWGRRHPERLIIIDIFTGEGIDRLRDRVEGPSPQPFSIPHITDADEVPLSLGLAERTLLWEEHQRET